MRSLVRYRNIFIAALLAVLSAAAWAAEPQQSPAADADNWRNFENLVNTISTAQQELTALRKQLQRAADDSERERLRAEVNRKAADIDSLETAWEMWATGGVDMQMFAPKSEEKFDWRSELQSVFEPIVAELRRLTERPRKIERLRSEQLFFEQRLAAAEAAVQNIAEYKKSAPSAELEDAFSGLEGRWVKRRDDLKGRLALVNFELQELLAPANPTSQQAGEALRELLSGRFLNLLLAVGAAAAVYGVLWLGNRLYSQYVVRGARRRPFIARVIHLVYLVTAALLALFAAMWVLYVRGDWILLGLLLIMLVGAALTLQRSLPAYLKEAKMLLNIGPVREGERVIYRGLPWKVQSLNVYSTLVNPALRGGQLRLPLDELNTLLSRPQDEQEDWFPTREDDVVLLADGTYGRVVQQTPELVQLRVGGALRSYPVAAFLDSHPQNLSREGFGVSIKFGIDYRHQAEALTVIKERLHQHVEQGLRQDVATAAYLKDITVDFDAAAPSSLDFVVAAAYTGAAADGYHRLRRLLQRFAIEAATERGWVIPYDQLTVHLAKD